MQLPFEQFKNEVSILDKEIEDHFRKNPSQGRELISDGIINVKEYYQSPIRIMWILKEPYCDKQDGGGGWSMTQNLNEVRAVGKTNGSQMTWHPIIYVSHGILNNFQKFDQMPRIGQDSSLSLVLRKIAFVNLQKLPARTRTNDASLNKISAEERGLVIRQIKTYRPHIVIGGKTLQYLKKDLQIKQENELPFGHFQKDGILYINTYHPAQTKLSRESYVNSIVSRTEQWKNVFQSNNGI